MKAKFGMIVTDGRGKLGGQVMSKNRAGAYVRTKVTPVNPQTSAQLGVRNVFTGFSQGWRGLTQAQRDAWNAAVSDFARTDIFGDLRNPTGFNLYQRLNNNLSVVGAAAITSPPLPSAVGIVEITSLTAVEGVAALSAVHTTPVPAGTSVKVFATAPQSAGRSFVKAQYRLITVLAPAAASPTDLLAAYVAKFGAIGAAGTKIFVKFVPVNETTGQEGGSSQASAIVTA